MDTEIQILPIFDQAAPRVWDYFVRIRIDTRTGVYNHTYSAADIRDAYAEHRESWAGRQMNFAFGAYDGANMIGFVQGECRGTHATVSNLYVLPAYRGKRLGRRLLHAAESAAAVQAHDIKLVSLGGACSFYEKMGYASPEKTNAYIKKINGAGCSAVLPVFRPYAAISHACDQICANAIVDKMRDRAIPMFVYIDAQARINGFLVANKDNDEFRMHIAPHQPTAWIANRLQTEFSKYAALRNMQAACGK